MVFTSVPLFVDSPNWHQHPNPHIQGGANETLHPPVPPQTGSGVTGGHTSRPISMAERARQAKIPHRECPLRCPRCESTNTKFCYFNNYSLSQPRHFCKSCRRYWTAGGALRNVPVGGGCRRNRRSKGGRPKSPAKVTPTSPAPATQLSFMASLQSVMTSQLGLGVVGQLQQLPMLAGLRVGLPSNSSFPFQSEGMGVETSSFGGRGLWGSHLAPVKMDENPQVAVNVPFSGGASGGWWTELARISSMTGHRSNMQ